MQKKSSMMPILIILAVVIIAGIFWLNSDISSKSGVSGVKSLEAVKLSDDNPTFDEWGKNFPEYRDMYLKVETETPKYTDFGGNLAYSKLIRYPQLTVLWAGYPFSLDANEERRGFSKTLLRAIGCALTPQNIGL